MSKAHILIIADTKDAVASLSDYLLPESGYTSSIASETNPPAQDVDLILVDVTQLRGSPFAVLRVQRNMGVNAPALLHAPRVTSEMAVELFDLNFGGFIRKPVSDAEFVEQLDRVIERVLSQHSEAALRTTLETTENAFARRLEDLNVLSRIGRAITSVTDLDEVLSRLVEATVYLTEADECVLYLYDEASNALMLRAQHGLDEGQIAAAQQPSPDSDASLVFNSGQTEIRNEDVQSKVSTGYLVKNAVHTPIVVGKTIIGVLSVHCNGRTFEDVDVIVLNSLADYAAIAIDKANFAQQNATNIDVALKTARNVSLHAETFFDPIDGIESNADALLTGGFEPLNEKQHSAVSRILSAAERMKEIVGFIRAELDEFHGNVED